MTTPLEQQAREVAYEKVGNCFTQGADVLVIARAVKASKYAFLAAAEPRDAEIAALRARVAELEGMVPKWANGDGLRQLEKIGWRSTRGVIVESGVFQLMVPPIPLPEGEG